MTDNLTPNERAARGYSRHDPDAIARIDARAAARAATEADVADGRSPFVTRPQSPTAADIATVTGHDPGAARREADRARDIAAARTPVLSDERREVLRRLADTGGRREGEPWTEQASASASAARLELAHDDRVRAARARVQGR